MSRRSLGHPPPGSAGRAGGGPGCFPARSSALSAHPSRSAGGLDPRPVGAPAVSDRPGLHIANPGGIRFSLLSADTFSSPGEGLAVLLYARTEADRTSASLYEIEQNADAESKIPLQMFRANQSVPFRRGSGPTWYLDAYLLPVRDGGRYGIYLLTWEATDQQIADVTCFFFPY